MSETNRDEDQQWSYHHHVFDTGSQVAERGTWLVMWITLAMMVVEIAAGWGFNSMALLADGWHMSSHVIAIGLSAIAYKAARRYAHDARFAFGTWKIEVLAGFTSAVLLLGIAALMVFGSIERILSPQPIHYKEAIVVAGIGLIVNVICAFILGDAHHHGEDHHPGEEHHHPADKEHHHAHDSQHQHHDLNLKSAYVHVMADAATSVLAIAALTGGWFYGWSWLDPVIGIVGAIVVAVWAKGLIAQSGRVLLDREMDHPVVAEIREAIESVPDGGETKVVDLHVWRVGRQSYSCALSAVSKDLTLTVEKLRNRLAIHEEIVHSTIEIHYRG
jgi:cation diffusion facilitator family transporter